MNKSYNKSKIYSSQLKLIGIDFSLNYPAACIANSNFTEFNWVACINDDKIAKKYANLLEDAMVRFPNLKFTFIEGKQRKNETYHVTERNKLRNQFDVVNTFVGLIKDKVGINSAIYAIEGLSFGAAGNTLLDITHATGILKHTLAVADIDWVPNPTAGSFVFAPSELKKAIGAKGNANKIAIFEAFLNDPKIDALKTSDLYKFIVAHKDDIFNGKEIKSPIMDMIDATLSIIHLKNMLS